MLPREKLLDVLKSISLHYPLQDYGYLRIKNTTAIDEELCADYLQKTFLNSGRYNPKGQPTIYLANSKETLNRQILKNCLTLNQSLNKKIKGNVIRHNHFRYIKFSFNLSKILDLRNKTIQNQLDTNLDELIPTIPRNLLTKKLISTQILGQIAKELDYDGLIVPIERNFDTDYYIVIFNFVIEKVVDNYYKIC